MLASEPKGQGLTWPVVCFRLGFLESDSGTLGGSTPCQCVTPPATSSKMILESVESLESASSEV